MAGGWVSGLTFGPAARIRPPMSIQKELSALFAAIAKLVSRLEHDADVGRRMLAAANGSTYKRGDSTLKPGIRVARKALSPDTILAALKGGPMSFGGLAEKTGGTKASLSYHLGNLREAGKVKMKGKKRAATWERA